MDTVYDNQEKFDSQLEGDQEASSLSDDIQEDKASNAAPGFDRRRTILWTLAGVYLVYMGGNLVRDYIQGKEGSGVGFMAIGLFFVATGAIFAIHATVQSLRASRQANSDQAASAQQDVTGTHENKAEAGKADANKMTIAQRARLGSAPAEEEEGIENRQ